MKVRITITKLGAAGSNIANAVIRFQNAEGDIYTEEFSGRILEGSHVRNIAFPAHMVFHSATSDAPFHFSIAEVSNV